MLALAGLLIISCGSFYTRSAELVNEYTCTPRGFMNRIPTVPKDVLLQVLLVDPHDREAGYRIYSDGRYESRPLGESWRFDIQLTPNQMQAVRAAILEARFENLQSSYHPPQPLSDQDGNISWYQITDDTGIVRTVEIGEPCKVSEINVLTNQIFMAFKKL
jgi:hypothetical protein